MPDSIEEQTKDVAHAEVRNFYKVEKWTRDAYSRRVIRLLRDNPILVPHHHASDFKICIAADIVETILALHLQGELCCLSLSHALAFG